ncbi:hypothetical protein G9A89_001124 [Geosiphon pyriformis]|nr:hypothetical protein G9A89_001124 [Geosiphon pyriformis]
MNMGNLDPLQFMQLKMLLNKFNDIFISENEFGRTDIIQHQIKTGDAMPIKQQAYRIPPQDTTQTIPFELVYGKTATLPVEIEINTYPAEPITEDNFQETLLKKTYDLMKTLENRRQKTADNIQKAQEKQKK